MGISQYDKIKEFVLSMNTFLDIQMNSLYINVKRKKYLKSISYPFVRYKWFGRELY